MHSSALSEGLRAELRKDGIVVTTVVPGLMRTGSPRQAEVKGQVRKELGWFSASDAPAECSQSVPSERPERFCGRFAAATPRSRLSLPAKLAVWLHGLFPGVASDSERGDQLWPCPDPAASGHAACRAKAIVPPPVPKWVTVLNDRAAERNNGIAPQEALSDRFVGLDYSKSSAPEGVSNHVRDQLDPVREMPTAKRPASAARGAGNGSRT